MPEASHLLNEAKIVESIANALRAWYAQCGVKGAGQDTGDDKEMTRQTLAQVASAAPLLRRLLTERPCNLYIRPKIADMLDLVAGIQEGRDMAGYWLHGAREFGGPQLWEGPCSVPDELDKWAKALRMEAATAIPQADTKDQIGTKATGPIFIGHGQSEEWKVLRDFIVKDLGLEYEEFDKEPTAGRLIQERLNEMLKKCCFAFLVMTAEDARSDGKMQARPNVVHELGKCQERYGDKKSIILLEEGCEKPSNTHGLVHIQFPKGNILAKSDEIRGVLERENILPKHITARRDGAPPRCNPTPVHGLTLKGNDKPRRKKSIIGHLKSWWKIYLGIGSAIGALCNISKICQWCAEHLKNPVIWFWGLWKT